MMRKKPKTVLQRLEKRKKPWLKRKDPLASLMGSHYRIGRIMPKAFDTEYSTPPSQSRSVPRRRSTSSDEKK
jgi:hypothetical protein